MSRSCVGRDRPPCVGRRMPGHQARVMTIWISFPSSPANLPGAPWLRQAIGGPQSHSEDSVCGRHLSYPHDERAPGQGRLFQSLSLGQGGGLTALLWSSQAWVQPSLNPSPGFKLRPGEGAPRGHMAHRGHLVAWFHCFPSGRGCHPKWWSPTIEE